MAAEVLARPEYQPLRPSLLERVGGWVLEQLGRALDSLGGSSGDLLAWAVILLTLGALVAVGLWLLRTLRTDRALADPVTGQVGRGPQDWAADAEAHERAGQWRDALRCRYRELIAQLAAAGLVEEAPGRTTGEYLGQTRAAVPAASPAATSLTRAFEAVWYGNEPAGPRDVAALRADAAEVLRQASVAVG